MPTPETEPLCTCAVSYGRCAKHQPFVTEARGAEAPRAPNQGAPARRPIPDIVADQDRRRKPLAKRSIYGEPAPGRVMEDGRICVGWHRTDTSRNGQRRCLAGWSTDLSVDFTDGSTDYVICITKEPL